MNCKCRHCTTVLAIVILVFSFWQVAWASWLTSKWIIVAAAVLILFHGIGCHSCHDKTCNTHMPMRKSSAKKKTARRRKRR
jgi:membrane-bound metal-dependent hydrolase YbcI (DUF457 family)